MVKPESIKLSGMPVMQNQQDFIVGVFKIRSILSFTKYTHRLITGFDEENYPIYNNDIQRNLEGSRVEKIADFLIEDPEATFPTNLVLHIPITVITKQHRRSDSNLIDIFLSEKVAEGIQNEKKSGSSGDVYISVIDGQHRLRGIEVAIERLQKDIEIIQKMLRNGSTSNELSAKLDKASKRLSDLLNIDLVVSFFVDKTLEYQAMIFATINRTQKRVSESLVYSLFGLTTEDSPQKTALQITLALNAHSNSPFYNRIKLYGGEYERKQSPPLSQATMVKSIIDLICENMREAERDRFKSRKELGRQLINEKKYLPFRKYYSKNEDSKISDCFYFFFKAVSRVFVINGISLWDFDPETMSPNNVLQTTVGYQALLDIMVEIHRIEEGSILTAEIFENYLRKASSLSYNLSNKSRYPFTSKSKTLFFLDMSLLIWPPKLSDDPRVLKLREIEESLD